jgi:antitoxin CptB
METESDTVARNRLRWKCRRGLLELDLVLHKYLDRHPDDAGLDPLLELPDNDLWDIIAGRSERYDRRLEETVARLRAA